MMVMPLVFPRWTASGRVKIILLSAIVICHQGQAWQPQPLRYELFRRKRLRVFARTAVVPVSVPPPLRRSPVHISKLFSSKADDSTYDDDTEEKIEQALQEEARDLSFGQRVKLYFNPPDDGLSFRQRLGKMGLACMLSYGWVSNMSYTVTVSLAWYIFSKQTGKSPLAPGQWKGFLAVYAGFWVFNNIVRPIRLAVSVAVAPKFDDIVRRLEAKFRISKAAAIGLVVFAANLVGTTVFMVLGIALAASLAGVPVWAK